MYIIQAVVNWLTLLAQAVRWACSLQYASAGSSKAARMAMMAITTKSSIKVNAFFCQSLLQGCEWWNRGRMLRVLLLLVGFPVKSSSTMGRERLVHPGDQLDAIRGSWLSPFNL